MFFVCERQGDHYSTPPKSEKSSRNGNLNNNDSETGIGMVDTNDGNEHETGDKVVGMARANKEDDHHHHHHQQQQPSPPCRTRRRQKSGSPSRKPWAKKKTTPTATPPATVKKSKRQAERMARKLRTERVQQENDGHGSDGGDDENKAKQNEGCYHRSPSRKRSRPTTAQPNTQGSETIHDANADASTPNATVSPSPPPPSPVPNPNSVANKHPRNGHNEIGNDNHDDDTDGRNHKHNGRQQVPKTPPPVSPRKRKTSNKKAKRIAIDSSSSAPPPDSFKPSKSPHKRGGISSGSKVFPAPVSSAKRETPETRRKLPGGEATSHKPLEGRDLNDCTSDNPNGIRNERKVAVAGSRSNNSSHSGKRKRQHQGSSGSKIVYRATACPERPVCGYALELISLVCNNAYCVASKKHHDHETKKARAGYHRNETERAEEHQDARAPPLPLQPHRVLDTPAGGYAPATEPHKERLMRLQLRQRFASASNAGMSPIEFARKLLRLWGGTLEPVAPERVVVSPNQATTTPSTETPAPGVAVSGKAPGKSSKNDDDAARGSTGGGRTATKNSGQPIAAHKKRRRQESPNGRSPPPPVVPQPNSSADPSKGPPASAAGNPSPALVDACCEKRESDLHHAEDAKTPPPAPLGQREGAGENSGGADRTPRAPIESTKQERRTDRTPKAPVPAGSADRGDGEASADRTETKKAKSRINPGRILDDPNLPVVLVMRLTNPVDDLYLSALHCFVRSKLLEVFVIDRPESGGGQNAGDDDNVDIFPNSIVGIRCSACGRLPRGDRGANRPMASFFPGSVDEIYHMVCAWQRRHFPVCEHVPEDHRSEYKRLREVRPARRSRKAHWAYAAYHLGLRDIDDDRGGLTFRPRKPVPPGACPLYDQERRHFEREPHNVVQPRGRRPMPPRDENQGAK